MFCDVLFFGKIGIWGCNWRDLKVVWGGRKEWTGMRHVVVDESRPGRARRMIELELQLNLGTQVNEHTIQSVRRKGGKSGKGHVYIICSLNPKHKQRQGK
jgi:ribosomal protein L36